MAKSRWNQIPGWSPKLSYNDHVQYIDEWPYPDENDLLI